PTSCLGKNATSCGITEMTNIVLALGKNATSCGITEMTNIVSALVQAWAQFKIRTQLRRGEIDTIRGWCN
ncbi:hypothetical protein, partial [Lysinibacillus sp. FJAT-14222]|uniref:hypothetical protein n=1 Tax=Lysinibacillus sp. FJAT-14222 TaxID=1932366 RepID=UPI0019D71AAF